MDIDDEAKQIVKDLGAAINEAVENSSAVAGAIHRLREAGYEMELTLRLEIGLRQCDDGTANAWADADAPLDLTDDDLRTLRRMKIRIDDAS